MKRILVEMHAWQDDFSATLYTFSEKRSRGASALAAAMLLDFTQEDARLSRQVPAITAHLKSNLLLHCLFCLR